MPPRPERPQVTDLAIGYIFDSLERIENKLDGYKKEGDATHNRMYAWLAALTVLFGGSALTMHLLGAL